MAAGTDIAKISATGTGNGELQLQTGNTTALTINTSANVGIGTTAPISLLDVQGGTGTGFTGAGKLSLTTAELTIVDNDVLGIIQFESTLANNVSSSGDQQLPAAAIWAEAEGTFSPTVNSCALVFSTAGSENALATAQERMRISYQGFVGIGENTPTSKLHVKSTDTDATTNILHVECTELGVDANDTMMRLDWSGDANIHDASAPKFISFHDGGGEIGYITTSADGAMVPGSLGAVFNSDIRLKTNIENTSLNGLEIINQLKLRDFDWNSETARKGLHGKNVKCAFIADEVYDVYPVATTRNPGAMKDILDEEGNKAGEKPDFMGIIEGEFMTIAIKAIQELSAKVDALENSN